MFFLKKIAKEIENFITDFSMALFDLIKPILKFTGVILILVLFFNFIGVIGIIPFLLIVLILVVFFK